MKEAEYRGNPQTEVEFANAIADFSQAKFEIKQAIDGKKNDGNNGWAISPQAGMPHWAAFAFKKPVGDEKGSRLRFEMNMPRQGKFTIARFRLWATTAAKPLNQGFPLAVTEALKKPADSRSDEDKAAVAAYWKEADPALLKLKLIAGKNKLPLPTDPGVLDRRTKIAKAEEPIKLDPKLVQLRQDAAQSNAQLTNKRLTAAQDLTWALVNNPAFLFNH